MHLFDGTMRSFQGEKQETLAYYKPSCGIFDLCSCATAADTSHLRLCGRVFHSNAYAVCLLHTNSCLGTSNSSRSCCRSNVKFQQGKKVIYLIFSNEFFNDSLVF